MSKKPAIIASALITFASILFIAGAVAQEGAHNSHLPVVYKPLPTLTPTPTPTPEPTQPAPVLQDGYYTAELSGDYEGWIDFRVRDNGATAYDAAFLYYWTDLPNCGARYWSWSSSRPISDGQFTFVATDGVSLHARLWCEAFTETGAFCTAWEPDYGGPYLGACGREVGGVAIRR